MISDEQVDMSSVLIGVMTELGKGKTFVFNCRASSRL
jgi:hypothetical protein